MSDHVGPESRRLTAINAHYRLSNQLDIHLFMNGVLLSLSLLAEVSQEWLVKHFWINEYWLHFANQMLNSWYTWLYFDLETTDATNDIQICQIACISPDKSAYAYILPTSCISSHITSITKLKVHSNMLLYNYQHVVTMSKISTLMNAWVDLVINR